MIKIKSIDKENVLDVCELKTDQDDIRQQLQDVHTAMQFP